MIILTQNNLPTNPLCETIDCLNSKLDGTSRADVLEFFSLQETNEDLYLVGDTSLLVINTEGLKARYIKNAARTFPPLKEMLQNVVKNKSSSKTQELVSKEDTENRMAICSSCEHFSNGKCIDVDKGNGIIEKGCGCGLNLKTRLANEKCPHGKW